MALAVWFERIFSRNEILDFYLCSVRYERGVIGVTDAIKHFFGPIKNVALTNSHIYFLIERVSNISSTLPPYKVEANIVSLVNGGKLDQNDAEQTMDIYAHQISERRIREVKKGHLERLRSRLKRKIGN
jgi:penicillin-binding protein 1A